MSNLQTNENTTILLEDFEAKECLSWLMTDSMNIQNTAGDIFRGGLDNTSIIFKKKLAAARKSISETEDDLIKIKEFLDNAENFKETKQYV